MASAVLASYLLNKGVPMIGKLFHKKRRVEGQGMSMMGGRRNRRGTRRMRGRGWRDVARKVIKFGKRGYAIGKKGYSLAMNPKLHALVKQGISTYREMRGNNSAPSTNESGSGRKRKSIKIRKLRGHGLLYNSSQNSGGPLP